MTRSRHEAPDLAALVAEGVLPPGRARVGPQGRPRGPGDRATFEWIHGEGPPLIVKIYPDRVEGAATYRILAALWGQAFGPGSPFQVPEPLGWSATHGALVMRRALGECLDAYAPGEVDWLEGLRAAARWLASLHASPLRIGPFDERSRAAERLARRASKAVERRPELASWLRPLTEELAARAPTRELAHTQTHGRYHPGHVFVDRGVITVIDLDRAAPAAPAKDVAEFIHRTRAEVFKRGWTSQDAEEATQAFLEEYGLHSPAPLDGLTYFWSESVLATLLHAVRKRHLDEETWRTRIAYYTEEFDRVPERVAACISPGARSWGGT